VIYVGSEAALHIMAQSDKRKLKQKMSGMQSHTAQ
jgi:hypothetical protein